MRFKVIARVTSQEREFTIQAVSNVSIEDVASREIIIVKTLEPPPPSIVQLIADKLREHEARLCAEGGPKKQSLIMFMRPGESLEFLTLEPIPGF